MKKISDSAALSTRIIRVICTGIRVIRAIPARDLRDFV